MDCGKYRRECLKHKIFTLPEVHLYSGDSRWDYDGGFSHESITRWASGISGVRSDPVHQLISSPNSRTFKEMIKKNKCVLAFFHTPWCGPCKRFMPRLKRVARFFQDVPYVKFAEIDSDRYRSFLREYELRTYPDIKIFTKAGRKRVSFEGKRSPPQVVEFINKHCGTDKIMTSVEQEIGLIDEANAILEEFFSEGRKSLYIPKMKQVPRASYYVTLMEGLLDQGEEYLKEEKAKWTEMLQQETTTEKEKDILIKKTNIVSFFEELIAANAE
jgi:thioredoxin-like negative regulator of GroEL